MKLNHGAEAAGELVKAVRVREIFRRRDLAGPGAGARLPESALRAMAEIVMSRDALHRGLGFGGCHVGQHGAGNKIADGAKGGDAGPVELVHGYATVWISIDWFKEGILVIAQHPLKHLEV